MYNRHMNAKACRSFDDALHAAEQHDAYPQRDDAAEYECLSNPVTACTCEYAWLTWKM